MIGNALRPFLTTQGHFVTELSRRKKSPTTITWDPAKGHIDPNLLEGFDVVINLCGESVDQRWSRSAKKRILASRVHTSEVLTQALAQCTNKPKVYLQASGANFYGSTDHEVTENESKGNGFLADVCETWEKASSAAEACGIRVVHLRMGAVLDSRGGALKKLLKLYRRRLGGQLGNGRQPFPWISIEDTLGAIYHCIFQESIHGPVNLVSPKLITNGDLNTVLAENVQRLNLFIVPSLAIRLLFGQMGKKKYYYLVQKQSHRNFKILVFILNTAVSINF